MSVQQPGRFRAQGNRFLALLLLMVAAAWAPAWPRDTRSLTISSDPKGARVYWRKPGLHSNYLGKTPLTVEVPVNVPRLYLQLQMKGYQQVEKTVKLPQSRVHVSLHARSAAPARQNRAVARYFVLGAMATVMAILAYLAVARRRRQNRGETIMRIAGRGRFGPDSGKRVGAWRLLDLLGAGGVGTVYRAVPDATLNLSEMAAVKVFHTDGVEEGGFGELVEQFRREVGVCKSMAHPNIVRLEDWGEHDGVLYLAMELVDGQTLSRLIRPEGVLPVEAADLLLPVFDALAYAHGLGVIHRDLKPENIMVTREGRVKVMDFGMAHSPRETTPSQESTLMGSPGWMAPEQIHGEALDARADQYSLGLIAFTVLAGRPPVTAVGSLALLYRHLSEEPLPSLEEVRPGASAALSAVLARMLAKDREQRYPTVQEARVAFAKALAASWLDVRWTHTSPDPAPVRQEPPQPTRPGLPDEAAGRPASFQYKG